VLKRARRLPRIAFSRAFLWHSHDAVVTIVHRGRGGWRAKMNANSPLESDCRQSRVPPGETAAAAQTAKGATSPQEPEHDGFGGKE